MSRIARDTFIASEIRKTSVAMATAIWQDAYARQPNSVPGEEQSFAWVGPEGLQPLQPACLRRYRPGSLFARFSQKD